MRKVAHTSGPWSVARSKMATDGAFDYAISAECSPVIAEAFGRDADGGWPNAEANARLIAAAPEMLEALKVIGAPHEIDLVSVSDPAIRGMFYAAIRVAQDLVAKAEGRLP